MGKISLLEDELIDKIAAGEVVERPASVVKELVENAIDAGAEMVRVDLEDGGKHLISVTDNGNGIAPEDGLLAVKRHATSKIKSLDDLFNIVTMGFRGEALASVASVSRFTFFSQQPGSNEGFKLTREENEFVKVPWNGARGTTVRVADLFYNVPVRKEFLKKSAAEFAAASDYMEALALSLPEVGFALYHNSREHFNVISCDMTHSDGVYKGEKPMRTRVNALLGEKIGKELIYVRESSKFGSVEALISPPGLEKHSAGQIYTFINGRWVKDKVLRYGVLRGYQSHILKGKFPIVVMHINIDPSLVDVNVHPTKTEIRLQYSSDVQSMIAQVVRRGLRQGAWASGAVDGENDRSEKELPQRNTNEQTDLVGAVSISAPAEEVSSLTPPPLAKRATERDSQGGSSRQSFVPYETSKRSMPSSITRDLGGETLYGARHKPSPAFSMYRKPSFSAQETQRESSPSRENVNFPSTVKEPFKPSEAMIFDPPANDVERRPVKDAGSGIRWSEAHYIGPFADCYLMFSYRGTLLVLDQHAFHERVLYEKLLKDKAQLVRCQPLLVPESIELGLSDKVVLLEKIEELKLLGFDIRDVPESTLVEVHAVPILLMGKDIESVVASLVDPIKGADQDLITPDYIHNVLARLACHAAVRAGEQLDESHVQLLMTQADEVEFYHNCPHGRRVYRMWNNNEVATWFDR